MRFAPPRSLLCCWLLPCAAAVGGEGDAGGGPEPTLVPESATHFEDVIRPVLVEHCGDCHSDEAAEGGVEVHGNFLVAATADDLNADRELWKSVAEQLRNRTMPPADSYFQPTEEQRRDAA